MSVDELMKVFKRQGLTRDDMVILSGAHTIGDAACHFIDNRLYNFSMSKSNGTGVDPSLPPAFAKRLKAMCPSAGLKIVTTVLDQVSSRFWGDLWFKIFVPICPDCVVQNFCRFPRRD